ncbi:serine protease [Segetibacter sp. 3557_3]|uniref:S8 family peptidase n=1 Tax=Segetibacter sp. 3557_3 TaxID=2547429 RepID=UPI001058B711|nr:S8/S53 family peptidase [Segetibacter sp. 3557_3]TDH21422.1 serine protease [Segetibacter sp. 3557_3]
MKKRYFLCAMVLILIACHKKSDQPYSPVTESPQSPMSKQQINEFIRQQLVQKGTFDWKDASDEMVWSALQNSDSLLSVGYQPLGETAVESRVHTININAAAWVNARDQVLDLIYQEEKRHRLYLQKEALEAWKEYNIPVVNVKVSSLKSLQLLRGSSLVRYAEPMGYDPIATFEQRVPAARSLSGGGSGCGGYVANTGLVSGSDYTTILPNAKASWNYAYHNIQNAWLKSTGAGVKIMVIDTGVSPDQENLGTGFNQGQSTNRTVEKIVTLPYETSTIDGCGHGTTMSGVATAPRCTNGNACGVAYNASLVVCRAVNDVFIDGSSEVKGVSDAYVWGANNSSVKIISMSLGRLTSSSQIRDAIQYAYGKGKLMFCAGGTSYNITSWLVGVIFPATLTQVQAVTGIQDKAISTACDDCHKGSQIDFVVVMEKQSTGLHGLSTAVSGNVPTTVGGSSVATATAAGIAALVWSRFPSYSRDQVLNKLTVSASGYPYKSSSFGWGKLNADAATN